MNKIYTVIVTYNGLKWIDRCLGSLEKSSQSVSIVVVDNASTDGTPDYISAHYKAVHLIRSDVNHGFAKANNIGIRYAYDDGADYVFLLNQDAFVDDRTIPGLCEVASRYDSVGVVSPIHMNGDGSALDWGFAGCVPSDFVSDAVMGELKETYSCKFVNAAAWLIKRSCLEKVGGFDTSMFVHYGEDSNYCHRLQYHNVGLLVHTGSRIYHDREFRKEYEQEYRNSVFNQSDLNRRKEFADITQTFDIDRMIKDNRVSVMKSYIKMKFSAARRHKEYDNFLCKTKESRETNMKGGLCWL